MHPAEALVVDNRATLSAWIQLGAAAIVLTASFEAPVFGQTADATSEDNPTAPTSANPGRDTGEATVAKYLSELEAAGLLDVATGSKEALLEELRAAEALLHSGASLEAAVALYGIVESPRFEGFEDFVEYRNAEYDLAVALALAGAYESALDYLFRAMERGPSSLYFSPAHRRAVDIAIETRAYQPVLDRLERLQLSEPLPVEASGERAYLRARAAYASGDLRTAEADLATMSRKSRLYSSSLYLRGVISTRQGRLKHAAEALCEIVDTPDTDKYTFVVDDRYFTIKDLARLGLGRLAHERAEYDDAYYHYFQIPDDSDRLPEALFEAAWSMYQKRELATARDLIAEFLATFPATPLAPEAKLLAGYIELADCRFDAAQKHFDELATELDPVLREIEVIQKSPERIERLFARALERWRVERSDPDNRISDSSTTTIDKVLGLLRLDPKFVRLHDAMRGLQRASGDAPHVVRAWSSLGRRARQTSVGAVAGETTVEQEDAADANALYQDVQRLRDELARARQELRAGQREKTLPDDAAAQEAERLRALEREIDALVEKTARIAEARDIEVANRAVGGVAPLIRADLARARALETRSRRLQEKLARTVDQLATSALQRLYARNRRIMDKARLGKIDAVIGQKGKLDIEVQDLAAGRWPPELHGRLWEEGLIGDDEEYWPFQGEYWADEYEGWR